MSSSGTGGSVSLIFTNVLIVNGQQYYYCSSEIQPDDTDICGLYCLYYFKWRHRGMKLPDKVKGFSIVDLKIRTLVKMSDTLPPVPRRGK
jgi:hypothetical protein